MEDSSRVLALLLVATIIVSLGGTIVSLNKIGELQFAGIGITGRVLGGTVQLNLSANAEITFTQTAIDFGTGWVNGSYNNCTMHTNSTSGYNDTASCLGEWTTGAGSIDYRDGFWIENIGSTNLTVTLNSSANATSFIGGSSPAPLFQWMILADNSSDDDCVESGSDCGNTVKSDDTLASCNNAWNITGGTGQIGVWEDIVSGTAEGKLLCNSTNKFSPLTTQNEFILNIKVRVPKNAPVAQGATATLTVTGEFTA